MTSAPHPSEAAPVSVSVVIPVFNRETTIRGAIESVLRQTWSDFELIVVDDGSSDGTVAEIEAMDDPRIRLIRCETNGGVSRARNIGIAAANGRWIAFQDSDDEWLPRKLEAQIARVADTSQDWMAVYCGMAVVEHSPQLQVRCVPGPNTPQLEGDLSATLVLSSIISTQMLMVRADVLAEVGGFDEDLPALVDWDLVLRIAEIGPIAFVDDILVMQRFSDNSITHNRARRAEARAKILTKNAALFQRHPKAMARQYQSLAGEQRLLGDYGDSLDALRQARRLMPENPILWARSIQLYLRRFFG